MKTPHVPNHALAAVRTLAGALSVALPLLLASCSIKTWNAPDNGKKAPAATESVTPTPSQFAGRAKLCGTYLSFDHYAPGAAADAASGRAFVPKLSLAVCGGGDAGAATWQALAVTLASGDVFTSQNTPATLSVTDKGQVYLKQGDATPIAIGHMEEVDTAMPIDLVDGAGVQLMVDDQPFQLEKHSKDAPGQTMVFTTP
jgi:hypothetical protein